MFTVCSSSNLSCALMTIERGRECAPNQSLRKVTTFHVGTQYPGPGLLAFRQTGLSQKLAPFHKNKIPRKKIAFERHAEQRERSGQKNTKYIYLVGSFTCTVCLLFVALAISHVR